MMSPARDFHDFLQWEKETHDAIDFKVLYVDMTGNLNAGILLSQIIYWRLPSKGKAPDSTKLTIKREGRLWLAKADADWWAEVRLSLKQARAARQIIEARGLITCKTMRFGGNPTIHISINEEAFMEVFAQTRAIPAKVRNAGWVGDSRAKRVGAKKPGSKPCSGNRTPRVKASGTLPASSEADETRNDAAAGPAPQNGEGRESRYFPLGNDGITESVITGLPERHGPDYPDRNNPIAETEISLTESPAEIPSERTSETPSQSAGGELEVTGNARAERPAETWSLSSAVIDPSRRTTTEGAALRTASVDQTAYGHVLAVAPDGANSEGLDLAAQTIQVHAVRQNVNDTTLTQVPPVPVLINVSDEQDHDRQITRGILERKLGGESKLTALMTEAPPGVDKANTTRSQWLTIPPKRALEILEEARASLGNQQHPWTAIISRLDQEIGAKILRGTEKSVAQGTNGGATTVLKPGATKVAVDEASAMNAFLGVWESRVKPEILVDVVSATPGGDIVLRDGVTLRIPELVTKYRKVQQTVVVEEK